MDILATNIQAARNLAKFGFPYFQHLILSLVPVNHLGSGTLAVDKYMRLYVDNEVVNKWPLGITATGLAHESLHIFLHHFKRLQNCDPHLANIAEDMSINDMLRSMLEGANKEATEQRIRMCHATGISAERIESLKLKIGDDWVLPEKYGFPVGLAAEEYYQLLTKDQPQPGPFGVDGQGQDQKQGQGNGQNGNQSAGNSNSSSGDLSKPHTGKGWCGSCATGKHCDWELPAIQAEGGSSMEGFSETEVDIIRSQTAKAMVEHEAKHRGTIPGNLLRLAESMLKPSRIPWQQKLAALVRYGITWAQGCVDYSWNKFSRRSSGPFFMPSLRVPKPSLAGIIDTSGSMSEDNLLTAVSEAQAVLRASGLREIPFLAVDAAVHSARKISDARQLDLIGGGGTDMVLGINEALKLKPRPQVILVFTDGYTPWPVHELSNVKIIAVLVGRNCPAPPAWINSVQVEESENG